MGKTMQDYLIYCLGQYRKVAMAKYGMDFDWESIERMVSKELGLIAKGSLTCTDLRFFEDEALWPFGKFASLPADEKLGAALAGKTFDFKRLPNNETKLIRELLKVLRSIDLVSIILRFVRPDQYGVISPPVERVLDLRRGSDAVQTYCFYLDDLRRITKNFGLRRTADADMALWVLHEKCFGHESDPEIKCSYEMDPTFLDIRVNNLILPLAKVSNARLAAALCRLQEKRDIAGLIACHEFEALIRKMANVLFRTHLGADVVVEDIINRLAERGHIDQQRKAKWKRLKRARNEFYHEDYLPTREDTREVLAEVEWLEHKVNRLEDGRSRS
jgi:hypothetical protein